MKILDSAEFYTKSWRDLVEIVLDEDGYVYIRRIGDTDVREDDTLYVPLSSSIDGDAFSKQRPNQYRYYKGGEGGFMCTCGGKEFQLNYGDYYPSYGLLGTCSRCKKIHELSD